MVTKKQKQDMKDYVYSFVEYISNITGFDYVGEGNIESYDKEARLNDFILKDPNESRSKIFFVLLDENEKANKKSEILNSLNRNDWFNIVPIYLKNRKDFFVRMVEKNKAWRSDKSLRLYNKNTINKMISLRNLEKTGINTTKGLFIKENEYLDLLLYYQPQSEKLEESIVGYAMEKILLDYSYLNEEERMFTGETKYSIDYKLPKKILSWDKNKETTPYAPSLFPEYYNNGIELIMDLIEKYRY